MKIVLLILVLQFTPYIGAQGYSYMDDVVITASSYYNLDDVNYSPDNIKIPGTKPWHSLTDTGNEWLQFVFPTAVSINGFRTKAHEGWDGTAFKNYRFEVSLDEGQTWQIIKEGFGINQDCCDWQEISVACTTSKYFRLFMVDSWDPANNYLTMEQFEFSYCFGSGNGVRCGSDSQCSSGKCCKSMDGKKCGECCSSSHCSAGKYCRWRECVSGSRDEGSHCWKDEECSTGRCCGGLFFGECCNPLKSN